MLGNRTYQRTDVGLRARFAGFSHALYGRVLGLNDKFRYKVIEALKPTFRIEISPSGQVIGIGRNGFLYDHDKNGRLRA